MKKSCMFMAAFAGAAIVVVPAVADASFTDVNLATEQGQAIQSLVDRGIVSGMGDGTFQPNKSVTRAQASKILAGALGIDIKKVNDPKFKDVPTTHAFYEYIAALQNLNILNGSDGYFKPDDVLTRGQMAKIIANAYKLRANVKTPFIDVTGTGYEDFIGYLYGSNITKGVTETEFGVNAPVTRGQMAVFIKRVEAIRPVGSVTFTHEELGAENSMIVNIFGLEEEKDRSSAASIQHFNGQTITIIPHREGTVYLNVMDPWKGHGAIEEEKYTITYQIDVTVDEEWNRTMTFTKLDAPIPGYASLTVPRKDSTEMLVTDASYNEVKDIRVSNVTNTLNDEQINVRFRADNKEYILHLKDENGKTYKQYAAYVEKQFYLRTLPLGHYTETKKAVLNTNRVSLEGYFNFEVSVDNPSVLAVKKGENQQLHVDVLKEGKANLTFTQKGREPLVEEVEVKKLGKGYVIYTSSTLID